MDKSYVVVIDTLGCDKGPEVIIKGACSVLSECMNLKICFTGEAAFISEKVKEYGGDLSRINIIEGADCITNYDHPVMAISQKTESSLVKALKETSENDEVVGMICAGSTGALLVGSMMYLKTDSLQRPCLAAVLPAEKGGYMCIADTGASIDCTSDMLVHFAHLGSDLIRNLYKIECPKVGLLSNGAEESKGNALVKETYPLLKNDEKINFIGNVEGSNALSGDCDVLVCDGFAGNQVLKGAEGVAKRLIKDILKIGKAENNSDYLKLAGRLAAMYDYNSLGGAMVLGVRKTVMKAHGSCNEDTIINTTKMILKMAENKVDFLNK